jgi:hypothetical protein
MDPQISSTLYWIVGVLVVGNIGTIVTVVISAMKGVWWLSKLDSRVTENEADINSAHAKIRDIERTKGVYNGI